MKDKKDKIYYFQEKSNDILDLQDELNAEEIGIYLILKAGYFKYAGELKKENANQRCKFFGDINKFNSMISKLFDDVDGLLVNNSWLSEIKGIKALSEKRKEIAESRWKKEQSETEAKPKQKVANASNCKQKVANVADNKSESKSKSKNKNVNEEFKSELINHNQNINLDFQEFWDHYTPIECNGRMVSKDSKKLAEEKYNKLRVKYSHQLIMNKLEKYLTNCKKNSILTKAVHRWLTTTDFSDNEECTSIVANTIATKQDLQKSQDAEVYKRFLERTNDPNYINYFK